MKLLGVAATWLLSWASVAQVQVNQQQQFYRVELKPGESLAQALNRTSPVRESGQVFHAYTHTRVDWRFWWQSKPNRCQISRVEVSLKLEFRLPKLLNLEQIDAVQRKRWQQYYPALMQHEQGHADIGRQVASQIEQRLLSLPPAPDCQRLSTEANAQAQQLLEQSRREHRRYDALTGHGKTQGAYLD